jgi:hypothetical protein
MKKASLILLSLLLISGCSSSVEGAEGKCKEVGEIVKNSTEFKVCLSVNSSNAYFSSGIYFEKALILGQLATFNSSIVEKNNWFESFSDEIEFNSSTDSQYIDGLWDASLARNSIEEITNGEPRWDSLIAAISNYVEAKSISDKAMKNFFDLDPDSARSNEAFDEMNEASEKLASGVKSELVTQLSIFLSYLRAETGMSNIKAARLTLDYLKR